MSVLDKVIAAVTPPESEDARREARARARNAATSGDWLQKVLDQHMQIEAAFESVRRAIDEDERIAAHKALALILTGHSNAEESVLYPALARVDEKAHATMAFSEQAAAKIQMGLLETLPPMSQDYLDKLEHIRGAVRHHMYEEEGKWFLELKSKLSSADQALLTARFTEEFERYVGSVDDMIDEDELAAGLAMADASRADGQGVPAAR